MWYTCTSSSVAIPTTYIWDFRAEMIKYNAYFRGVLVGKSTWINVRLSLHSWLSSYGLLVKINYGVWGVLLIINIWFLSYSYGWLIMYWYTNISQIWPHLKIINRQWISWLTCNTTGWMYGPIIYNGLLNTCFHKHVTLMSLFTTEKPYVVCTRV